MKLPGKQSEQKSAKKGSFVNMGACLCRCTPNGMYYARVEKEGKEFRRNLDAAERTPVEPPVA